jgi:hypothetical protein
MLKSYAIRNWNKYFENNESRKIRNLTWIPMVNKHDGRGYRRVAALPNSVQVFCAWNLIVQVASKMPTRGVLLDEDGALTAADLAAKTGYPEAIFTAAFLALIKPEIRWLEEIESELPGESPGTSRNILLQGNRREGKGTEGNRRIEPKTQRGVVSLPNTLEEAVFMAERAGVPRDFCETHYHRVNGKGWVDGNGNPLTNWSSYIKHLWNKHQANILQGLEKAAPAEIQKTIKSKSV